MKLARYSQLCKLHNICICRYVHFNTLTYQVALIKAVYIITNVYTCTYDLLRIHRLEQTLYLCSIPTFDSIRQVLIFLHM